MALVKKILQFKTKIICIYGKRGFITASKSLSEIKYEENTSRQTHFGFENVKETEKAEKGRS
jgi:hypothetical protein